MRANRVGPERTARMVVITAAVMAVRIVSDASARTEQDTDQPSNGRRQGGRCAFQTITPVTNITRIFAV